MTFENLVPYIGLAMTILTQIIAWIVASNLMGYRVGKLEEFQKMFQTERQLRDEKIDKKLEEIHASIGRRMTDGEVAASKMAELERRICVLEEKE